ncbi:MAG: GTPase [Thermoplasmata archaeon]|nr:MAG: GTPase [Thermoplasmata archaeon]
MDRRRVIIMGAAGRDFHNFNVYFRDKEEYEVVAFTATQIPDISGRRYPSELAGSLYPNGIPIYPEENLSKLIKEYNVDDVVFAYSDVPYDYVMEKSAIVNAAGANFILLGPKSTMIKSRKPVIAICAVRTGCGKSQVSRAVFKILREKGFKVASIRHPMPYDPDLTTQISQRFASYEDLDRYNCTIEEREEYEPYINMDGIIYAGVDYGRILREAEEEADIIIWDGGNNDFSFYKHDMLITLADPHRPGHELSYYPGSVNTLSADIIIINKVNTARREDIEKVRSNIEKVNPSARIIEGISTVFAEDGDKIRDKRVLVIEDGPTVTHGSMPYGAGTVAANEYHAKEIVDPRPFAVGSIKETFEKYKHLLKVLPAMGYGRKQMQDLEETINRADVDLVVSGTPIDLNRVIKPNKPIIRVRYDVGEETLKQLREIVDEFIDKHVIKR